jgi:hypothetical protein
LEKRALLVTAQKRAGLLAIAAQRGLRGHSQLIDEALDLYLAGEEENRGAEGDLFFRCFSAGIPAARKCGAAFFPYAGA